MAAIHRAAPALPCLAISCPSRQAITADVSPGTLSKIEAVEPPYITPVYVAANIKTEPKGSKTNIIGNIIARAPADPIPGKTPTTVPKKAPPNA